MNMKDVYGKSVYTRMRVAALTCDSYGATETCAVLNEDAEAVKQLLAAVKSAREWHLGDKYRGGSEVERLAWKQQLELYDAAIASIES